DFADETAQVNALQAGQVDLVDQLSYPSVAPIEGNGGKVVVSKSAAFVPFAMQTQTAPFDDVRVRQALRLLVDREQFNEQVFGGLGSVGNDIYGSISPAFKSVPQREQDVEQAKSLLKAAGQSSFRATLYSSATGPGAESGAAVFASQAKAAGVEVTIETQPSTQFWGQTYSKVPFFLSVWTVGSYLVEASQGLAKGAPFPETQQADAAWQNRFEEALRTVDKARREEISEGLMKFDYEQGGYIIPVEYPSVEGMSAKVKGVIPNISGYAVNGGRGLQDIWMSA
ncbi:MAG: peptide ABC transporter substrate-binding protein, partial [Actinobacteria bacterium]|nr:peptide ABC transporter substrate-binding protein [Actinomycetota bacterium]